VGEQIRELLVLEGITGQRQQAGITTLGGRMTGNQPVRKIKIKIVDVHVLYRHGSYRGRQGYLLCHEEKTPFIKTSTALL
jgi:hypothetical protein